ncbi:MULTISPECIES: peroxiredoxin-like family protein [Paenibacillus]|uniref:peroxiredoxin-like family protein n=1 Tax=Paenibacillus TaxID=44249 RepID=UPI0022B8E446|nr:peroxiredoxin-like family protein [Paenibacillus caseinilyticus]MCZ8521601.1 peroxiredoxin-like family protein [Paenibacillus caseinilyticus]
MSVKEQLEQIKAGFITKVPPEAQERILHHIREQQQSGTVFGLKEGEQAPNFTLGNPLGEQVSLQDELGKGPVVLTFYRGAWCPFCNVQLRAYQQALPGIQQYGGRLIAVSPQSPDHSLTQKEKEQLTFQVLSDPDGRVAEQYNLLFELPDSLQNTFKHSLRLDLTEFNQTSRWVLPVTATFILGQEGIVRRTHVNPDFMQRMETQDIIDELKKL